ncbi:MULTISPECIES: DUF1841 family protein [Zoogloea]|jgi:hypothetical protein|uniref:DUF1841 family protein n=1 Tax=Zoogloea oleivorans TaxID=1552750 RepID=A0A6C2CL75_9RHOO|nr:MULTISPECIES: DUF1841 family protein [Zoogloea]MDD2668026.1 DUF1841 family protein [Zoogloea sp.]MDY0037668.1 DUF1841 family protein [Zoogloea oleivorans]TYC54894.1 DUF1841 family protein [Zoogloea oleivorans]
MFDPSREQARQFFVDAWRKHKNREILTQMEVIGADLVAHHPEYHSLLEATDSVQKDFSPEDGQVNPFLHLSLHLAIEEQLSINQPPGIREAFEQCQAKHGDRHAALHDVLEALGETIWRAQRDKAPLDGLAYVEAVRKKAGS